MPATSSRISTLLLNALIPLNDMLKHLGFYIDHENSRILSKLVDPTIMETSLSKEGFEKINALIRRRLRLQNYVGLDNLINIVRNEHYLMIIIESEEVITQLADLGTKRTKSIEFAEDLTSYFTMYSQLGNQMPSASHFFLSSVDNTLLIDKYASVPTIYIPYIDEKDQNILLTCFSDTGVGVRRLNFPPQSSKIVVVDGQQIAINHFLTFELLDITKFAKVSEQLMLALTAKNALTESQKEKENAKKANEAADSAQKELRKTQATLQEVTLKNARLEKERRAALDSNRISEAHHAEFWSKAEKAPLLVRGTKTTQQAQHSQEAQPERDCWSTCSVV